MPGPIYPGSDGCRSHAISAQKILLSADSRACCAFLRRGLSRPRIWSASHRVFLTLLLPDDVPPDCVGNNSRYRRSNLLQMVTQGTAERTRTAIGGSRISCSWPTLERLTTNGFRSQPQCGWRFPWGQASGGPLTPAYPKTAFVSRAAFRDLQRCFRV